MRFTVSHYSLPLDPPPLPRSSYCVFFVSFRLCLQLKSTGTTGRIGCLVRSSLGVDIQRILGVSKGYLGLGKHSFNDAGCIDVIGIVAILVIAMFDVLIVISIGQRSTFWRNHRLIRRMKSSLAEVFPFNHHNMELVKRTCC